MTLAPDIERTDRNVELYGQPRISSLYDTVSLCLTGMVSRTARAVILSAYHMPVAGGCK